MGTDVDEMLTRKRFPQKNVSHLGPGELSEDRLLGIFPSCSRNVPGSHQTPAVPELQRQSQTEYTPELCLPKRTQKLCLAEVA